MASTTTTTFTEIDQKIDFVHTCELVNFPSAREWKGGGSSPQKDPPLIFFETPITGFSKVQFEVLKNIR